MDTTKSERKPVEDFMDVVTDHMDLDFEEKRFLHEQAHNIYNKTASGLDRSQRRGKSALKRLVRLREWLEKQQEQSLDAIKDSVEKHEEDFFHGCRKMAKDTLKWLDENAT